MLNILLTTISVFALVFIEHFFGHIFGFSIFFLLGVFLWSKIKDIQYLIYFPIASIILDITMGFPFGVHILTLFLVISLLTLIKRFMPSSSTLSMSITYTLFLLLTYLIFAIIKSLLVYDIFPDITLHLILFSSLKSLISGVIIFFLSNFWSGLRNENFEKIRLR